MEVILPVAFLILCGTAFLTHRVCPKGIEVAAVTLLAFGALALGIILFAPKDYMLHLPNALETILHPWILALASMIFLTLGVSGLIGSVADRIVALRKNER
jgi:hypothetical protein